VRSLKKLNTNKMKYSKKQINEAISLRNKKVPFAMISRKTGIATGSINYLTDKYTKTKTTKGYKHKVTPELFSLVKLMKDSGIKTGKMVKTLSLSYATIARIDSAQDLGEYKANINEDYKKWEAKKQTVPTNTIDSNPIVSVPKPDNQFDQYNTLIAKMTALQFDIRQLRALVEATQVKKFSLFK